jgi:hypothetical protein
MAMPKKAYCLIAAFSLLLAFAPSSHAREKRWSVARADHWYSKQPWLVGSNYIPATAINQLEMWQADTFDSQRIDLELGWAESLGMNTMRVFLHDLLWQQDAEGFKRRIDIFLQIASKHKIKPIFVLFDSCWDANPHLGKQPDPKPGVHNSGWVQSPGAKALQDASQYPRLEAYVRGVVGAFAGDTRILAWDIWNEPPEANSGTNGTVVPSNTADLVTALLPKAFAWARLAGATQPLTSGVYTGDWSNPEKLGSMERIQLGLSDIVSFHNYDRPEEFEKRVLWLQQYHRPIFCTEYMARGNGSTFQGTLPIAKKYRVAAYNWGFVAGKTQTYFPWDSWQKPYTDRQPVMWFHDIFRRDGQPYMPEEVAFIRSIIGRPSNSK